MEEGLLLIQSFQQLHTSRNAIHSNWLHLRLTIQRDHCAIRANTLTLRICLLEAGTRLLILCLPTRAAASRAPFSKEAAALNRAVLLNRAEESGANAMQCG